MNRHIQPTVWKENIVDKVLSVLARLLMAQLFITSGWQKLTGFSGTEGYFAALGIPMAGIVTPLVILIELGGGLALLSGFKVHWVAAILAAFTVGSALIAHTHFADPGQAINFMKNLSIVGGLLWFSRYGAGAASIDAKIGKPALS
jgi:putative oxidoreductase